MDLQLLLRRRSWSSPAYTTLALFLLIISRGASGVTFTFVNRCQYTVWPGILANAGSPSLDSTGFELPSDSSRAFQAPTGWSGRFWGRTGCSFDGSLSGSCGSGQLECNGLGAAPPATLAQFTLGSGGQDFSDVSLVDGYNFADADRKERRVGVVRLHRLLGGSEPAVPGGAAGRGGERVQERVRGVRVTGTIMSFSCTFFEIGRVDSVTQLSSVAATFGQ